VCEYVLEVLFGLDDSESLDGLGGLVGIFIVDAEIFSGSLGDWMKAELPLAVEAFLE